METDNLIIRQRSIREAGHDEAWLRDRILENPSCLGLGENVEVIDKERHQPSGGRLDLLLKDEDDTMYEVELMLGETDETHIVRTIEYWDNEKRKWPMRGHYAVLIAEHINRRFFNVIHHISHSIPIIAIQAVLLDEDKLFFNTILDPYVEIDDGTSLEGNLNFTREDWLEKSKSTVDAADILLASIKDTLVSPTLKYLKFYVAINAMGRNFFALHKRSGNKSLLRFRVPHPLVTQIRAVLDAGNVTYDVKQLRKFNVAVDHSMIEKHKDIFRKVAFLIGSAKGGDSEE